MPKSCCRSCPRCADCPVRVAALARARANQKGVAALVDEVFAGRPPRPLPDPVTAALAAIGDLRRPAQDRVPTPV